MSVGSGFIAARDDDLFAVRHAALEAACPVRLAVVAPVVPEDLVVSGRAALAGQGEAVADLDSLHGLDAHQRRGEPRVEAILLRRVRAEARRHAARANLDDAADGVALRFRRIDVSHLEHRAGDLDPDLREQSLRDRTGRDRDRRLPRTGPLERVPRVVEPVLERPRQIGVPGARQRHRLRPFAGRLALGRPRAHPPLPVRVVAVPNEERERRAERAAVAQAGDHLDAVLLELLPRTSSVALLATREIRVDRVPVELEPGRQAAEDPDERRAVRLARSCQPKRHEDKPTAPRIISTGAGIPVQSCEGRGALRDEHLQAVDHLGPRRQRCDRGRRLRIRKVDEGLSLDQLDENVVSLGGRVHDQVRVADFGWPVRIACEDTCVG